MATRFLAILLPLVLLVLVGFMGLVVHTQYSSERDDLADQAVAQAGFLGAVAPEAVFFRDYLQLETLVRQTTEDPDVVYAVVLDREGRSMTRYLDREHPAVAAAVETTDAPDVQTIADVVAGQPGVREVRLPIESEGDVLGEVRLGYSIASAQDRARTFGVQALAAGVLLALVVAGATAAVFEWQVRRPLRRLTAGADALAAGDLDRRIDVARDDEIGLLERAFNEMADELVATLNDIESARDLAEEADRAKSDFLANMSHEIRTPMNAILGLTGLVLDSPLTDEQRDLLVTVQGSGNALLDIINEILDFSKIEAGRLELESEPFDLRRCARDAVALFGVDAGDKGVELLCRVAPDVPEVVEGDATRLRQVLLNLVGNAVKFTSRGEVELRVAVDAEPFPSGIRFEVRDTGIGIEPDRVASLFDPFSQADSSTTRRFGGTGLGLTISQRLVTAMGGSLTVESASGSGSTFQFTIPLPHVPSGERLAAAPDPIAPVASPVAVPAAPSILVAEDNLVNQKVVLGMLERLGCRADVAGDGLEALAMLEDRPYDVVLMDVQMPRLDGVEATKRIRATLPLERQPRVVALTANALKGDRERYLRAGMDDYVSKPISLDELAAVLGRRPPPDHRGQSAATTSPPADPERSSFDPELLRGLYGDQVDTVLAQILPLFETTAQDRLASMEAALGTGDAEGLCTAALTLKGEAFAIGAIALADSCDELAQVGGEGTGDHRRRILDDIGRQLVTFARPGDPVGVGDASTASSSD